MPNGTLLIVDDDPLQREYLATLLADGDYESRQARDGAEALDLLARDAESLDGVLLDWRMPGLDGLETLKRIKADPALAQLPVIFQTGSREEHLLEQTLAAGAHFHLTKPVQEGLLLATVHSAVQARFRGRELRARLQEASRTLALMDLGHFRYRTVAEAECLSSLLASVCPDPERAAVGLMELLVNAVEHGNLEITYEETGEALATGGRAELLQQRLEDPRFRSRTAEVRFERKLDRLRLHIRDEGPGFDWRRYLTLGPDRAFDTHGRGVFMAARAFDRLAYEDRGNAVTVEVLLPGSGA